MTDAIVTCSEHFTELALNELRRHHPRLSCIQQISPQHFLIRNPGSFGSLARPWKQKPPIYLHHMFPVHHTVPLTQSPDDFSLLRQTAHDLCSEPLTAQTCTVQARICGAYAYPVVAVIQAISPGQYKKHIRPSGRVLSVLIDGQTAYMGISWAAQNLASSGGEIPYFDEPVPNRAGLKLLEALETFAVRLRPGMQALDLGAAPGAWTEILRRRGLHVTAVAPRAMYDWLQTDPAVHAYYMTAEEYLAQCDTAYDLLINDMKLDAQDSARLMVDYARHLRPGGIAIMTLKLRMRHPRTVMDHAFRLLRKAYRINRVRQLISNRKEVTLYLRRSG